MDDVATREGVGLAERSHIDDAGDDGPECEGEGGFELGEFGDQAHEVVAAAGTTDGPS